MPRLLELFSGTGSIGRSFRAIGWDVTSVDMDPKSGATIITDVGSWNYAVHEAGRFDCIWASPPCTHYSRARTTAKTPRDLEGSDRLVQRVLDIIQYHNPSSWFMENPQTGLLKDREVVKGLANSDTSYCRYGYPYKKATRIWHNCVHFEPEEMCSRSFPCHGLEELGHHETTAQRGPGKLKGGPRESDRCSLSELYSMPKLLCDHIAAAASAELGG
jgi:hypothetical protein